MFENQTNDLPFPDHLQNIFNQSSHYNYYSLVCSCHATKTFHKYNVSVRSLFHINLFSVFRK